VGQGLEKGLENKNPVFRGIMELVDFFAASWGLVGQRVEGWVLFICHLSVVGCHFTLQKLPRDEYLVLATTFRWSDADL
jgi:hypothetical protein